MPVAQQTPQTLAVHHKAKADKWWPIIKAANIKAEWGKVSCPGRAKRAPGPRSHKETLSPVGPLGRFMARWSIRRRLDDLRHPLDDLGRGFLGTAMSS